MLSLIVGLMLVFSLAGCDNGTMPSNNPEPQSITYISEDSNGNIYTLVVTENTSRSARYAAQNGDSFTFTVVLFNGGNYNLALTYSGKIDSAEGDETEIELVITVNGKTLTITISGTTMTVISGTIVLDNDEEITITEPLTPATDKRALELVINAANAAKEGVVVSANGTDVLTTVYWVSEARWDTFITAIAVAQAVYDDADSDQSMVNSEKIRLTAATNVFNGQKRLGTKTDNPAVPAFTSVAALGTWLAAQPANTAATAYTVALNVNDITNLRTTLNNAANKYVYLDLSGSIITAIPDKAFHGTSLPYGCATLTGVTIGNGVTSIGDYAFYGCSSLTGVTIPDIRKTARFT